MKIEKNLKIEMCNFSFLSSLRVAYRMLSFAAMLPNLKLKSVKCMFAKNQSGVASNPSLNKTVSMFSDPFRRLFAIRYFSETDGVEREMCAKEIISPHTISGKFSRHQIDGSSAQYASIHP